MNKEMRAQLLDLTQRQIDHGTAGFDLDLDLYKNIYFHARMLRLGLDRDNHDIQKMAATELQNTLGEELEHLVNLNYKPQDKEWQECETDIATLQKFLADDLER